jgi:uncharacterized membrane protein
VRRTYIDWLRGVAVLFMIEWHTIDAWTADAERVGPVFSVLAFVGGWAAPLFLFLAGVSIPFAADAQRRKGCSDAEAAAALQRRGWQVWVYAHLFRAQSYLLNPSAVWHSIFKPDILNILGLGIVGIAALWGRARTTRGRAGLWIAAAIAVLILAPLSRGWWWPSLLHPRLEAYIRPSGNFGVFALLPWVAYMFAGALVGLWIAQSRPAADERGFHGRLALAGLALMAAGAAGSYVPSPFTHSTFWSTSGSLFALRTGAMTLALAAAWLWLQRPTAARWSPIVLFGQTSLFVYWVHVELAYGIFSAAIKRSLTVPEAIVGYLLFSAMMLGMAHWWKHRTAAGPWIPLHLVPMSRADRREGQSS